MSETKTEGLIYKGHPLRRIDNLIYYGTMADPYIVMMQILESKKENGLDMATKVSLQLVHESQCEGTGPRGQEG